MEKIMATYKVINKYGISWASRFVSEHGAWSRLLALKGMENTTANRLALRKEGWTVRQVEVTSEAAQ